MNLFGHELYAKLEDKVIVIPNGVTSIGYMGDNNNGAPFESLAGMYQAKPKNIIIPDSVITANLSGCMMTDIVLPNRIQEIMFMGCTKIEKINLPVSVKEIQDGCFMSCHNLKEITIPNSVTKIGSNAFDACCDLTEITIPSSVEEIGEAVFANCYNLEKIYVETGTSLTYDDIAVNGYDDLDYQFPSGCEVICPDWD